MSSDLFHEFDDWLIEHGSALAIPMRIIERDQDMIRLKFDGITDAIEVVVGRSAIMAVVKHHDGTFWDTLFTAHLFQPFATWVETKLLPLASIGLGGSVGGYKWATLLPADNHRDYSVVIPLRGATAA